MIYLDDLKYMKLYKKKFFLPINLKDRRKGSAIILLSPNRDMSDWLMNYPLAINKNGIFSSYYMEKDIMYIINNEGYLETPHDYSDKIITEASQAPFIETTDVRDRSNEDEYINEVCMKNGNIITFFNEMYDEELLEATAYNVQYKKLLYRDRIRNNKGMKNIYAEVKRNNPWIRRTFYRLDKYKRFNLFVDLYYYNQSYTLHNKFNVRKTDKMYYEFIRRSILDKRIDKAGYNKKTVFVPLIGWGNPENIPLWDWRRTSNPIALIYKRLRYAREELKCFNNLDFVFMTNTGYFKMDFSSIDERTHIKFVTFIKRLLSSEPIDDSDEPDSSVNGITTEIIDTLETNKGIEIHNLTGESNEDSTTEDKLKDELVKKVNKSAKNSVDAEETLNKIDKDDKESEEVKKLIQDLEANSDSSMKLSSTRLNRISQAQDTFMKQELDGKSVSDMVNEGNRPKELPSKALPIKSINKEWKELKAVNFEKEYDLNADIVKCLNSLSDTSKEYPVSVLNISYEDTSTTEDSIYTYTVQCEGYDGKRFSLKFDIPKFRDGRFMRLGGNEKVFSIEMPLIPISKTDNDIAQIATFYNKIFVESYNTSSGNSNPYSSAILRTLSKVNTKKIETYYGDNRKICTKYDLPIDYIDMAQVISKIVIYPDNAPSITIYFNQDELRQKAKVDDSKGIPIAITSKGEVAYYTYDDAKEEMCSEAIAEILCMDKDFADTFYSKLDLSKKVTYSRARILNTAIPIIVILAHDIGLTKAMDLAGIQYEIVDKKNRKDYKRDYIKFANGFIAYKSTYTTSMLMNGLKDCDTESINIESVNQKITWVDQLENFGGRIKSDGLDNFKDLMMDPISVEVCKDYKLPYKYHEVLIYASNLLVDNTHVKHNDLSTNRYRTNEVIAAQFYRALSSSYKDYALQNKHGRKVPMTMNQNAVIVLIMQQNTTSDLSVFQPLQEIESRNSISTKGVTGLNSERAYRIDKRGYDDSMLNIISQSTGFATTAGVNRQTTINPNIVGGRGYFKQSGIENMSVTNTLSMTEALSPFVVTSDDPFRNAMTFVQTSKHTTPISYSTPELVTTGADQAMPYMCSDMYAHKAKSKGKVEEITDDYMIIRYSDNTTEYVNLEKQTMKNSDGGFYIDLQLTTDLKVGDTVKQDQIIAYDKKSFSTRIGHKQVAYNMGCMTKVAILTTEDGFEDSGVCSEFLSEQMSSDITVMKNVSVEPSTNILYIAKKGQKITEGEPILIFQNSFDEEDANILLRSLNTDDGDLSEIGRIVIKSKVTGILSDIKIFRTVDIDQLSPSLQKIVNARESDIKRHKKIADKAINEVQFDSTEKLPQKGKLKDCDGVRFEFFMEYHDKLSVGDKLSSNANKTVLMDVYKDEDAPYTDFRPNESIDLINSCSALDGRMITSIIKLGALNKCMIELSRSVCEIMGVEWKTLKEMYYDEVGKK